MAEKFAHDPSSAAGFSDGTPAFGSFVERNQKLMAIAAGILILGTGGWLIQRAVKASAAEDAATELSTATGIDALKKVATDRASTPAGPTAAAMLAEEQWKAGQHDAAIETLRSLISSSPEHPAVPTARASLAGKLMQEGKNDEAAALFQQIVGDANSKYLAPYALIGLGDLAKTAGKTDEASKYYTDAKENYGTNQFSQIAQARLTFLKFKAPTEIEAPPAPVTPELPAPPDSGIDLPGTTTPGLQGNPLIDNFKAPGDEAPANEGEPATPGLPAPADPGK